VGSETVKPYAFISEWKEYVLDAMGEIASRYPELIQINVEDIKDRLDRDTRMPGRIPSLEFPRNYVPYAFISRLLRLADRRSQGA
jgi:hypothetical protein